MSSAQNDQVKLRKRLEALLKLPDNQTCADCRKRGPRWASANLGIFICIECSGIHRNLGVHISFVRSVNLDSWTKQQVEFMEEWGNGRANEYFEANVPSHVIRPKEGDPVRVVERFIRDKYEFKKFIAKSLPPKHESHVEVEAEPESVVARRASKHHGHHGHHGHHSHHHKHEEAPKVVEVPKPAAPAPAPAPAASLIDFMDDPAPAPVAQQAPVMSSSDPFGASAAFPVATSNVPATNAFDPFAAPAQAVPSQGGFNGFDSQGNFATAAVPPAAPAVATSGFDFMAQPQQQPQPPKASADAILSLYSTNMNRGGPMPMPMGGGFNQPMYPPNHPPPMMNVNPNQQMPRPMGFGGQAPGYPPQMHQQPPYQGMNFNQGPPPVNPFAPHGGMPMQQGYPGNYQQQFQQPPTNPFQPNPGMPPMQMNSQQYQGGWQQR